MTGAVLVVAAGLYILGIRRYDARHHDAEFPRRWVAAFAAGIAALVLALVGPVERLAGEKFSWHMVQHLLLVMVAPPLLLLGRPFLLARRGSPTRVRRVVTSTLRSRLVHFLTHPVVAWVLFVSVLWATHFTGLYQLALTSGWVHIAEHGLYFGAGLLFWFPVVGAEPSPRRLSHAGRLLYLFTAAAAGALLASTLYQSARVLYPAYGGTGALSDQHAAGAIMWIGEGLLFLLALLMVTASWARQDRREADRADSMLDRLSATP
jgi:cytochrome c oxidase assembly factor CtaG